MCSSDLLSLLQLLYYSLLIVIGPMLVVFTPRSIKTRLPTTPPHPFVIESIHIGRPIPLPLCVPRIGLGMVAAGSVVVCGGVEVLLAIFTEFLLLLLFGFGWDGGRIKGPRRRKAVVSR